MKRTVLAAFVALSVSCGSRTQSTSQLDHNSQTPVRNVGASGVWTALSDAEYETAMAPLVGIDPDSLVAANDDLTKRAQAWLDLYDRKLRAVHPDQLKGIPSPRAKVVKTTDVNAFVSSVVACYTGPVSSEGQEDSPDAVTMFLDFSTGAPIPLTAEEEQRELDGVPCRDWNKSLKEAKGVAAAFNAQNPACKMSITGQDSEIEKIEFTGECKYKATATKLVLTQVADIVHFFTGIFTQFKEEEFASVIAHELGHYYRSHGVEPASATDFFYKLSEVNPDHRPERDSAYDSLIPVAEIYSKLIHNFENIYKVAQQKQHSAYYLTIGSVVKSLCASASSCPTECSDARTSVRTSTYLRELGSFPFTDLNSSSVSKYSDHEKLMQKCLDSIAVTDQNREDMIVSVAQSMAKPVWPSILVSSLSPSVRRAVATFSSFLIENLQSTLERNPNALSTATSVGAIIKELTATLNQDELDAVALYDKIYTEHLGQYTNEQEADELSVEWTSLNGIDPKNAVSTYLEFAKFTDDVGNGSPFRDITFARCEALYQNGWRNASNQYDYIALGNLLDTHHGSCYRAFNTDREIVAHGYRATGTAPAMITDGKWPALQSRAESLGQGRNPPNHRHSVNLVSMKTLTTPKKVDIAARVRSTCTFAPK